MNEVPRIYTSFAEFEREELQRLGLDAWLVRTSAPPPAIEESPAVLPASVLPPTTIAASPVLPAVSVVAVVPIEPPAPIAAPLPVRAVPVPSRPIHRVTPTSTIAAPLTVRPTSTIAAPPTVRPDPAPSRPDPAPSRPITRVTPASLRAEGILEIGCATGTSALYVRTRVKLHLLHSTWVPERQLDDYAVSLAVTWIEGHGLPSCAVAKNLGVSENTLRNALTAAGYERLTPKQHAALATARSARKFGNRRGRLVRATAGQAESRP